MSTAPVTERGFVALGHAVASQVSAPAADQVDRDSRLPKESIDALRAVGLLSAYVPTELGGGGASLSEVVGVVAELGRACSSTAMIYAMHQIQVACLVRHGRTPALDEFLRHEVVGAQALLASSTTEAGIGGDVRSSSCAVELADGRFTLHKNAPVISYGEHADAVLVTARRNADSPPSDQVLVLCRRADLRLAPTSEWDALGMRGTCSRGFLLDAEGGSDDILPDPYSDISGRTMLPVSHILWAAVWFGIATQAAAQAHAVVRSAARRSVGTLPPSAVQLAELEACLLPFESLVTLAAQRFDDAAPDDAASMRFAVDANSVKVAASRMVLDIVNRAMSICGMAGYLESSERRLGRLLRDAHSAPIMVGNDRILANNAQLLLAVRER